MTTFFEFSDGPFCGEKVQRFGEKGNIPLLFVHNDKTYATNLFKLHDQIGFSLADSIGECRRRGWIPCIQQFVADALKAGWPRERAERIVRESGADA